MKNMLIKCIGVFSLFILLMHVTKMEKIIWEYTIEIFLVIISCTFFDFRKVNLFDISLWVHVVIGYASSPIVLCITYYIVFRSFPKIRWNLKVNWSNVVNVIEEEMIWRCLVYKYVHMINQHAIIQILLFLIFNIMFIYAHPKRAIGNLYNGLEMFLYSFLILVGGFFCEGFNYGLHLGRNDLCD